MALFIVSVRCLCSSKLISTDLFSLKSIQPTLFRLHLRPKMPTFSSSSADENCLCACAVFFFSSRYPRRVSEYSKILTHQNSLLSLLFFVCLSVCFILFWSSLFGELRGLPEISCVPSAQSPFLIDCVFDPETG